MAATTNVKYGTPLSAFLQQKQLTPKHYAVTYSRTTGKIDTTTMTKVAKRIGAVRCSAREIGDFIGGDLLRFDLGKWLSDVEEHKALAIYSPHEGGYEGRYLNRLIYQGYYFLDLSARGLGDPETTLTKIHPVCPVS